MGKPVPRVEIGKYQTVAPEESVWVWSCILVHELFPGNGINEVVSFPTEGDIETKEQALEFARQFNLPIFYNGKEVSL